MKNFNDIYEVLYKEYSEKLEKIRKEILKEIIITIVIIIGCAIILTMVTNSPRFIELALIILIIKLAFSKKKAIYRSIFKEEIIQTFVKEYDNNLDFNANRGISRRIYDSGEFERYDLFSSEDLITGFLEGKYRINMSEVHTQEEHKDSDGDTHYTTLFHGIFAEIEFGQFIFEKLKLRKDKLKLFGVNRERVELDSSEFEKIYDVYSTNKIMTMQLLTSDIMQMFIDFKEKYKIAPELTLKQNKLYIRFQTGNMFEATVMKNALDYETLLKYYETIKFSLNISKKFIKNVKETEI